MLSHAIMRGACAGLLAGLLTGLFALVVAEPSIDAAIALEEAAETDGPINSPARGTPASEEMALAGVGHSHAGHGHSAAASGHHHGESEGISRGVQKFGLVAGLMLYGLALGAAFGVLFAWSRGRVQGDPWSRTVKLGACAIGVLVVLPAVIYPPNPPAVGDPSTVGLRSVLFFVVWGAGIGVAFAAWHALRRLQRAGWSRPVAHSLMVLAVGSVLGVLAWVLPAGAGAPSFPADLLWSFRISAVGTQVVLIGAIACINGLLVLREEQGGFSPAI